jgi:putative Holliday junction resolvase
VRLLGIDLGDRRVGLAVGESTSGSVRGLPTMPRGTIEADTARLRALVVERRIDEVVVGLPLNTDGTEGSQAAATRDWTSAVIEPLGLPVAYRDERFTSQAAEASLGRPPRGRSGGPPSAAARERRRRAVDREAACRILQGELDARRATAP